MKNFIILVLCFISFQSLSAQKELFETEMEILLKDPFFKFSQIAVEVYDLTSGNVIYRKNEKMLLNPASNMKILTSAAALKFLGGGYQFETKLFYSGEIKDSVLHGDIYIAGGCDPDFTYYDLDTLLNSLIQNRIKEIRGNLYGDVSMLDSLFWGSGWMWDDDLGTDFPYLTPLILNDASVRIIVSPGDSGKPANVDVFPKSEMLSASNNTNTIDVDSGRISVTRNWIERKNDISILGNVFIQAEPDTFGINIFKPELHFLYTAKELISQKNINFTGSIGLHNLDSNSTLLAKIARSYGEVIINLNKQSDNLSAEMALRALGSLTSFRSINAENGIELIDSLITLSFLNPKDYRLVDGSGVSRYNLVSAELICEMLKYIYIEENDLYKILRLSFPLAGVDGTLKSRMKEGLAYQNVSAKTGTLSGVSALSGYLTSKNEHTIVFSILIQNFVGSARTARNVQDKICEILSGMEF